MNLPRPTTTSTPNGGRSLSSNILYHHSAQSAISPTDRAVMNVRAASECDTMIQTSRYLQSRQFNRQWQSVSLRVFSARQHAIARYMLSPAVCLFVRHTGGSVKDA